jgi:hypothetical protein
MHLKIKTIILATCIFVAVIILYLVARIHATRIADRDVDAFFIAYREGDIAHTKSLLINYPGSYEVAKEIMVRHKDALQNFDLASYKPRLNLLLNKTKVEVSWNLAITFSKKHDAWIPTLFNEYQP